MVPVSKKLARHGGKLNVTAKVFPPIKWTTVPFTQITDEFSPYAVDLLPIGGVSGAEKCVESVKSIPNTELVKDVDVFYPSMTFYCHSVSKSEQDKITDIGDGSEGNPFKDLNYALTIIRCIMSCYCFKYKAVLFLSGVVDYKIASSTHFDGQLCIASKDFSSENVEMRAERIEVYGAQWRSIVFHCEDYVSTFILKDCSLYLTAGTLFNDLRCTGFIDCMISSVGNIEYTTPWLHCLYLLRCNISKVQVYNRDLYWVFVSGCAMDSVRHGRLYIYKTSMTNMMTSGSYVRSSTLINNYNHEYDYHGVFLDSELYCYKTPDTIQGLVNCILRTERTVSAFGSEFGVVEDSKIDLSGVENLSGFTVFKLCNTEISETVVPSQYSSYAIVTGHTIDGIVENSKINVRFKGVCDTVRSYGIRLGCDANIKSLEYNVVVDNACDCEVGTVHLIGGGGCSPNVSGLSMSVTAFLQFRQDYYAVDFYLSTPNLGMQPIKLDLNYPKNIPDPEDGYTRQLYISYNLFGYPGECGNISYDLNERKECRYSRPCGHYKSESRRDGVNEYITYTDYLNPENSYTKTTPLCD